MDSSANIVRVRIGHRWAVGIGNGCERDIFSHKGEHSLFGRGSSALGVRVCTGLRSV